MKYTTPPFREPCIWAAKPPEHWDCLTHGGVAADPLDLSRSCQKRMDLALAEIDRLEQMKQAFDASSEAFAVNALLSERHKKAPQKGDL